MEKKKATHSWGYSNVSSCLDTICWDERPRGGIPVGGGRTRLIINAAHHSNCSSLYLLLRREKIWGKQLQVHKKPIRTNHQIEIDPQHWAANLQRESWNIFIASPPIKCLRGVVLLLGKNCQRSKIFFSFFLSTRFLWFEDVFGRKSERAKLEKLLGLTVLKGYPFPPSFIYGLSTRKTGPVAARKFLSFNWPSARSPARVFPSGRKECHKRE